MGQFPTPETQVMRLAELRRRFLELGQVPEDGLTPVVLKSWQRCRELGITADDRHERGGSGRAGLSEARERSESLLNHASGIMEHIFEQIRASGSMVLLADAEGLILHGLGDPDFVGRANRVALQPGASWSETDRGTNAIGTALAEGAAVEVFGHEHYLERNGVLTCSAAPVFDPSGQLLGVLDISADYRNYQRHTLGLVRLAVRLLERRLFEAEHARQILLCFHARPECVGGLQEAMLAVAADGEIIAADAAARELLGPLLASGRGTAFGSVFKTAFGVAMDRAARDPSSLLALELRSGATVYARLRTTLLWPGSRGERPAGERSGTAAQVPRAQGVAATTLHTLATGDAGLQRALDRAARTLGKDIPLLIQGESGVGKELFARAVHNSGPRRDGPFVAVNCAAIPENLIESELFGYTGGAFTGARREGAVGRIQQAHGGTLFLDEIGDMPLGMQARLLRVLQERCVTPVGASRQVAVDISLVCATHRLLREAVRDGSFREDLYYRVNGLTVTVPPLRERSDIGALVDKLLAEELADAGFRRKVVVGEEVMRFFEGYAWPGNVRQLHNVIRVAVALLDEDETEILPQHLPEELFGADPADLRKPAALVESPMPGLGQPAGGAAAVGRSLDEVERETIAAVMQEVGGNVSAAARRLGISRNTLYRKLGKNP
ncbi:GAF domain-containing protein [Azoarcus sp. TTM-91]|uniref:sigma-54-dependent Fis family transcriptional regulator n=1 Tax=Azoarcus sp. TTM-91 TaxID=2691581 RepID=UPI00145F7385|nr:sigma-54-dependent Fis family transcriptional regulator [Azoarcus sp. TTM-91]NMG37248.1 GAF domain-containing protein [Azoarcus sp. TTM-91]